MLSYLKKIGKHTAIFSVTSMLSKAVGFLLLPLYTRYLNPADYGVLELLAVVLQMSVLLAAQGLPQALVQSYAYKYQDDKEMKTKAVNTAFVYLLITAILLCGLIFIFSGNINSLLFGEKNYSNLLRIVAVTIFLRTTTYIPNALMRVRLRSIQISVAQLIHLIVNLSLNIYFIVFLGLGVKGVIYGNVIAELILVIIMYKLIVKDLSFSFSFSLLKALLSFGLPLIPAALSLLLLNASDRMFLQKFSTTDQVGLYALGYKISTTLQFVVIQPFLMVWPSIYFPMIKRTDARENIASLTSIFVLLMSFFGLMVILLAKPAIMIMAPREYWDSHLVCYWIVPSVILYGFYYVVNVGINIKERTKLTPVIIGIAALINLVFNFFLIPHYGMMGAAVSTFLSFVVLVAIAYYYNHRIYPIPYQWGFLFRVAVLFAISSILAYQIKGETFFILGSRFLLGMFFFSAGLFLSMLFTQQDRLLLNDIKTKIISSFNTISMRLFGKESA